MNIDLFLTDHGECGLLCEGASAPDVAGVIFDAQVMTLTLEYVHGETLHLNIPVHDTHRDKVLFAHRIYVGHLADGLIADSREVPMLYLNDPYGGTFSDSSPLLSKPRRSLVGFEQFLKRAAMAQPVHRANLSDEGSAGCVLRGTSAESLQYVPKLRRERMLETAPRAVLSSAPGLALGGTAGTVRRKNQNTATGNRGGESQK